MLTFDGEQSIQTQRSQCVRNRFDTAVFTESVDYARRASRTAASRQKYRLRSSLALHIFGSRILFVPRKYVRVLRVTTE